MRLRLAAPVLLGLWLFSACGGRTTIEEDGFGLGGVGFGGVTNGMGGGPRGGSAAGRGGVSTGTGGAVGIGGKASGGAVGIGGKATGGSVGVAGTGPCACDPIACPSGYRAVPTPDGCCFRCEPACAGVVCPMPVCPPGIPLELAPGACCPSCGASPDCARQQAEYQLFRRELWEKFSSLGCVADSDCTIFAEKNQCGVGCPAPLSRGGAEPLARSLEDYAASSCSSRCPLIINPCPAVGSAACDESTGRCIAGFTGL